MIEALLEAGTVVIAGGGGGIPVVRAANGDWQGVQAVVDKDLTSALLARSLGIPDLLILTAVERVAIDFNTPRQRFLDTVTLAELKGYHAAGHFAPRQHGTQGRGGDPAPRGRRPARDHRRPGAGATRAQGRERNPCRSRLKAPDASPGRRCREPTARCAPFSGAASTCAARASAMPASVTSRSATGHSMSWWRTWRFHGWATGSASLFPGQGIGNLPRRSRTSPSSGSSGQQPAQRIPAEGFGCLLIGKHNALSGHAQPALDALERWLVGNAIVEEAQQLIGLGPGLTPSGDDYLGGMLVALRRTGRTMQAEGLWRWLQPRLRERTSAISAAHLTAAAAGEGHEALHSVLDGELNLDALDAVGHTSGWDALAGAAAVLSTH